MMWSMSVLEVGVVRVGFVTCWNKFKDVNRSQYFLTWGAAGVSISTLTSPVTTRRSSHRTFNWLNKLSTVSIHVWKSWWNSSDRALLKAFYCACHDRGSLSISVPTPGPCSLCRFSFYNWLHHWSKHQRHLPETCRGYVSRDSYILQPKQVVFKPCTFHSW